MEGALFSRFRKNFRPAWRFWELWRSKMRFGQNVLRMTWKERFVQFSWGKCTVFPFWREFQAKLTILRTLTLKNAIWPKRAAHDLKSGFCTIFLESALFFCFEEMRMTWKERLVQFSWKAHCFLVLERISGPRNDFENFDAQKCDLAKTCCAWPEKSVLYNFHEKRTVFPLWREFEASFTILRTLALKNKIWPKRAAHDLKRGFCTIFLQSALFFRFEENLRPVSRFSKLWFGQKVLRMTWKERFVQFALKAHCFLVLERIPGPRDDFENFHAQKYDLAKTCCAWPEKNVLYNFLMESALFSSFGENLRPVSRFWELCAQKSDLAKTCCAWPEKRVSYNFLWKRTVFLFWREFQASFTILKTLTLKNAISPKRAAHDL